MQASRLAAALALVLMSRVAEAQDLFDRASADRDRRRGSTESTTYRGRDRLDLRVGATLPSLTGERGSARLGIDASIESDFACGRFDLRANLKNLLGKEARDQWLDALIGALESELISNALVLVCEASPTACQAFQHFRVNANALLGIQYNRCQAVESAVNDSMQGIRANAIKDCVDQKRRAGLSMEEALNACQNAETMRARDGQQVREIDLMEELRKGFNLSGVDLQNVQGLLSGLRLTPRGAHGEIKADAVLEKFDRLERDYAAAWSEQVARAAQDPKYAPSPTDLTKLWPAGALGLGPDDLRRVAKLPDERRQVWIRKLAGRAALLDLTQQVQRLERMLRADRSDPNRDEATVRIIERQVDDLRLQLAHIEELLKRFEDWNAALLETTQAADARELNDATQKHLDARRKSEAGRNCVPRYGERPGCEVKPK